MAIYYAQHGQALSAAGSLSRTHWTIPFAVSSDVSHHVMCFQVKTRDRVHANDISERLVDDTKDRNKVAILRLGNELGQHTEIVHHPFSVSQTHISIQEVYAAKPFDKTISCQGSICANKDKAHRLE